MHPDPPGSFSADRNVRRLYLFTLLRQSQPHLAVWVVYLTEFRELTLAQVGILEGFFWVAALLAEIPTGAFADRFGRRLTFVVGAAVEGIGILTFGLASDFAILLTSYVLWSLGIAFATGNDTAYLYDSLASEGQQHDYTRRAGRLAALAKGAIMAGSIAGSAIAAAYTLQTPILLAAVPYALAIPIALRMQEPPRTRPRELSYGGTLRAAMLALRRSPGVRWLILFQIALSIIFVADFLLMQPFLRSHHVPIAIFGLLQVPVRLAGAAGSVLAHRVADALGLRGAIGATLAVALSGLALLAAADHVAAFAGFVVFTFATGVIMPSLGAYVNDRTPSEVRATVLSVAPLGTSIAFALAGPTVGIVGDFSLRVAFGGMGGVILLLAGGAYLFWLRIDRAIAAESHE
jgi:MFS family permease